MVTHESQIFPSSPARKGKPLVTNPASIEVPPYYPDTPLVREELARVYDNIADMDAQVGEILKQLEDDGLAVEHDRLLLERSRRRRAAREAVALRLGAARAADDSVAGVGWRSGSCRGPLSTIS